MSYRWCGWHGLRQDLYATSLALLETLTRRAYMYKDDGLYSAGGIVMWETGSHFDFVSNVIQNTPRTIRPTLTGLLNGTISMSAVNATLGLNTIIPASIKPPWNSTTISRQWNISQAA